MVNKKQPAATEPERTAREIAESRLEEWKAADTRAQAALKRANADVTAANRAWEECTGAPDAIDATRQAKDDAEKRLADILREGEHRRTGAQLKIAEANLKEIIDRERTEMLEFLRPKIAAFGDERAAVASKWIVLDRQIAALAAETLILRDAQATVHGQATVLCRALEMPNEFGPAPTSETIAGEIQRAVNAARTQESAQHRADVVALYLGAIPDSWQTRDMDPEDRVALDNHAKRQARIARDQARVAEARAAYEAGQAAQAAQQESTTEDTIQ